MTDPPPDTPPTDTTTGLAAADPPPIPAPRTATDPPAPPGQVPAPRAADQPPAADDLPDPIVPPADGEELAPRDGETDEEFTRRLIATMPPPTPELIERIAAMLGYLPRRR